MISLRYTCIYIYVCRRVELYTHVPFRERGLGPYKGSLVLPRKRKVGDFSAAGDRLEPEKCGPHPGQVIDADHIWTKMRLKAAKTLA